MKRLGSFFDEIYGFDGMSSFLLFISVILNLVTGMWPSQAVNNFNLISYLPLLGCIFRVFSRNHERRAHENECFLKLARPLCENIIEKREEQAEAKLFRFFKCPVCKQKLRVPKGKGKVEITCPKCGNKFIKKAQGFVLRSKGDAAVEESVVGLPEGFFLVFFEQSYRKFTAANYSKSYKISFMESYNRLNDIQIL